MARDMVNFNPSGDAPSQGSRGAGGKPRLLIDRARPDVTVASLRSILRAETNLFDRDGPVRIVRDELTGRLVAQPLTTNGLIMMVHGLCQPYEIKTKGPVDVQLPRTIADMYLDWRGGWELAPLHGIASAPLLGADGSIHSREGYDPASGMWCERVPELDGRVVPRPGWADAMHALNEIRRTFATFAFADAAMVGGDGARRVDAGCDSAWNKDPVFGVIGIQTGPRG